MQSSEALQTGVIWIVLIYFLHTLGELCLSPVGLSSVTKLSPQRIVGFMMGMWFFASAAGNYVAGLIAKGTAGDPVMLIAEKIYLQVMFLPEDSIYN